MLLILRVSEREGMARSRPPAGWVRRIALCAAHFLVLQTLLVAFTFGVGAVTASVDAFGNVICDAHRADDQGDHHSPHHTFPGCCTFGCGMFAPALATPDSDPASLVGIVLRSTPIVHVSTHAVISGQPLTAGRPRAPPLTV
jgi:hypothetical protein